MIKVRKDKEDYLVSLYQVDKINTLFTDRLGDQLKELVEEKDVKIYFDLSKIRFIDSSGFAMLKRIHRIADENSSEFILCNVREEVEELFKLLELQDYFINCKRKIDREVILIEVE